MLKQNVQYTDYNDEPAEEELYFNLTKTEIADNLDLKEEVEKIQKSFQGVHRNLMIREVRAILNLVKRLMKLAYGIRSDDGKRFVKSEELWVEFTQTAAYDAYLFSLFEKPEKAYAFILGIMPQDIRAEAETMAQANSNQEAPAPTAVSAPAPSPVPAPDDISQLEVHSFSPVEPSLGNHGQEDDRPAWVRENREPTRIELQTMSQEELREAYSRKLRNEA